MSPAYQGVRPAAEWQDDCNGKQDYDGPLLSLSSRLYPPHKGDGVHWTCQPSIIINHTVLHSDKYCRHLEADYATLSKSPELSATTEKEIKRLVEKWFRDECTRIVRLLGATLPLPTDGASAVPS